MGKVDIEITIDVVCEKCGLDLDSGYDYRTDRLSVYPCENCIEIETDKAISKTIEDLGKNI
jgi:hypothetical protein